MKEGKEVKQNRLSSHSSKHSAQDNEEVINNFSYEDYDQPDSAPNEEQHINEDNKMLMQSDINKVAVSPSPQSPIEEEKPQEEEKEQGDIVIEQTPLPEQPQAKVDKTIFSKLSEGMYNSMVKDWKKKNNFFYDEFINERFLESYSDKINGDNNKKIKDFMERNDLYNSHKYYTLDTINHRVDQLASIKREKESGKMNKKQCDLFIEKQLNHIQSKQKRIETMRDEQTRLIEKEIRKTPAINKQSKLYPYKTKPKAVPSSLNKSKGKPKKAEAEEHKANQLLQKQNEKKTNDEIKKLVDKLYQKSLKDRVSSIRKCKSCSHVKEGSQSRGPIERSTSLLIEVLMSAIEKEVDSLKHESLSSNPVIDYYEYSQLLSSMGYVPSSPNELRKKATCLIKDAWNDHLTKVNTTLQNSIDLHILIVFLLYLEGFLKEEKIIKKRYPWLKLNNASFSKEIKTKYSSLLSNRKQVLSNKKRADHLLRNSISTSSLFSPCSFKPKLNSSSSTDYFFKASLETSYHPIHRLRLFQSYHIIPTKHNARMRKLKDELDQQALADCTFFPNNKHKAPLKRSTSTEVSNRLYSSASKHILKNKLRIMSTSNTPLPEEGASIPAEVKRASLNSLMFSYNPFVDDYLMTKSIERYEKTRLEKQLRTYMKAKGVYAIEQLRLLAEEDLCNEEKSLEKGQGIGKGFRFDNEIKSNKESFDKFNRRKLEKKELLLSFEIKIQNKPTVLNYYKDDNIEQIVNDFVRKHHLSIESKKQIMTVLVNRLAKTPSEFSFNS